MINLCFKNGNLELPISFAKKQDYKFDEIAKMLNLPIKDVFYQFNRMIKESGYKLFN